MSTKLVRIELVRNPKAIAAKPFVARLCDDRSPDNCLEFLKPAIPKFAKSGVLEAGEYELEIGVPYIVRVDWSSHRNARYSYDLVIFDGQELKTLASIDIINRSPSFKPNDLKFFYARHRSPIAALWAYWRSLIETKEEVSEECMSEDTITPR
jgi:hypothetical protein